MVLVFWFRGKMFGFGGCLFVVWLVREDERNGKDGKQESKEVSILPFMWPLWKESWRNWLQERLWETLTMTSDALGWKWQSPSQCPAPKAESLGDISGPHDSRNIDICQDSSTRRSKWDRNEKPDIEPWEQPYTWAQLRIHPELFQNGLRQV